MVNEPKFFRKQADRADRLARSLADVEASRELSALAQAYRSQAAMLKDSKKHKKAESKKPSKK
jgi:hypothetical protein